MWRVALLGCVLGACGGYRKHGEEAKDDRCSDVDLDGYGTGLGCAGTDCDDTNRAVWDEADCEAICAADPHGRGCPCDRDTFVEPEICYSGSPETIGVGPCRTGMRQCLDDRWSPCNDEVAPTDEVCDGLDQDCDGALDDGVLNACGFCGECQTACVGRGEDCAPWDLEAEGVGAAWCEGEDDCITVDGLPVEFTVAWLPNTSEGTISRIDTETHEEVGRYLTSREGISATPSPSRTSVDWSGGVVVANRAFGAQASAAKIAAECEDQDGDGRVETSTGPGDVLPWGDDECFVWSTDVGEPGGIARAVAVDTHLGLDGVVATTAWIGLYAERRYVELDEDDGAPTGVDVGVAPCTPYMAAMDRDGNLWSSCLSTTMVRFDGRDPEDLEVLDGPAMNYGIAVDPDDGRIWTGGAACSIYDPEDGSFATVPGCTGYVPVGDGAGTIWMSAGDRTLRIDTGTLEYTEILGEAYGIAIDFSGMIWAIPAFDGFVNLIDPDTEEVTTILDDCGGPCLAGTYTYGDLTGYQLVNHVGGSASYTHVFEGCAGGTQWRGIDWDATLGPGSAIGFSIRSADTLESLAAEPWTDVATAPEAAPPAAFEASGHFLEVRAVLEEVVTAPLLYSFGVQWECSP